MFVKALFKNPILTIGIILFALFIFNPETNSFWKTYTSRFKPDICRDVKERAQKLGEAYWSLECKDGSLYLSSFFDAHKIKANERLKASYRELANELTKFSKVSNPETIIYLKNIIYKLSTDHLILEAYTTGEALEKLSTLKDKNAIAFHIHTSVKVKEIQK